MATILSTSGQPSIRTVLSAATTAFTLTNGNTDGQEIVLIFQQDSTGGRLVSFTNVYGFVQPAQAAGAVSAQVFVFDILNSVWVTALNDASASGGNFQTITAAGAVIKQPGLITIGGASATAATLVAPVSGGEGTGDDGMEIEVSCITAHAHTLTTPANTINSAFDTVTFAAIGDAITLQAHGGIWYVTGAHGTATLSEV
jgi:hypothetical protein